jgi:PAS domain S-box-containing protein
VTTRGTSNDSAAELEAIRREYHQFRYHLPDALVEIEIETFQVVHFNHMAELLFGYTAADFAAGLSAGTLLAPEEISRVIGIIQRYTGESRTAGTRYERAGRQELYEVLMRRRDGSTFWAETQSSFMLDAAGVPVRMASLIRDVTGRKEAERERQRLLTELQDAVSNARQLRSLLVVCEGCRRIHDGLHGEWTDLDLYVKLSAGVKFEDVLCPECVANGPKAAPAGRGLAW